MLRKFATLVAFLLAVPLLALLQASPAQAGNCTGIGPIKLCGFLTHHTDDGYDPPIIIQCDYGNPATNHFLYEGERSTKYCKDTDQIYVRAGEEFWCLREYGWTKVFDATGYHKINDDWSDGDGCVLQLD